jgi:DNA (cytosine-5)-methyltransferase 1
MHLVLSLFPGIDLLGRGFEAEGFAVVRGPDLIFGQRIEDFHAPQRAFVGVIAGSPCQNFSLANRTRDKAEGNRLLAEFARVVTEANPDWWLLENVPTVPTLTIPGYHTQRLDLRASECGLTQRRLRHFQYGTKDRRPIIPDRDRAAIPSDRPVTTKPCCLASEGTKTTRRNFADFCELQGLPRDFDLPEWPIAFKYRAVGNGVPIPMARVIARAIVTSWRLPRGAQSPKLCACDCGRVVASRRVTATAACRKRIQRKKDALTRSRVTGTDTPTPRN